MFASLNNRDSNGQIIYDQYAKNVGLTKNIYMNGSLFFAGKQYYGSRNNQDGIKLANKLFDDVNLSQIKDFKYITIGSHNHNQESIAVIDTDNKMYVSGYNNYGELGSFTIQQGNVETYQQNKTFTKQNRDGKTLDTAFQLMDVMQSASGSTFKTKTYNNANYGYVDSHYMVIVKVYFKPGSYRISLSQQFDDQLYVYNSSKSMIVANDNPVWDANISTGDYYYIGLGGWNTCTGNVYLTITKNISYSIFYSSQLGDIIPKKILFNQCDNNENHFSVLQSQDDILYYAGRNNYVFGNSSGAFTMFNITQFRVKDFTLGRYSIYVLDTNGNMWSIGYNGYGQLAIGTSTDKETSWKKVTPPEGQKFVKICSYYYSVFCLTNKGNLYSCGLNDYGMLGTGNTNRQYSLVKIGTDNTWKDVQCGFHHMIALDINNNIYGCGYNGHGQLGLGNTNNQTSIVKIKDGNSDDVKFIYAGGYNSYYVNNNGQLYVCGYNSNNQIVYGTTNNITSFTKVDNITNVRQLCCTHYITALIGEKQNV